MSEPASLRAEKDQAYAERNHLVAALARLFPSGTRKIDIPGWDPAWHGCVYIDLPTGQISYHYHESQAELFAGLPAYEGEWDGHDKATVHARLGGLNALTAASELYEALDEISQRVGYMVLHLQGAVATEKATPKIVAPTAEEIGHLIVEIGSIARASITPDASRGMLDEVQWLRREVRDLRASLLLGIGATLNEMAVRRLPFEWSQECALGRMCAALGLQDINDVRAALAKSEDRNA